MAYDFRCKWCGHSESHHIEGNTDDRENGYRFNLGQCLKRGGYELSKKNVAKELEFFQAEGVSDISGLLSKIETKRSRDALERESLIGD